MSCWRDILQALSGAIVTNLLEPCNDLSCLIGPVFSTSPYGRLRSAALTCKRRKLRRFALPGLRTSLIEVLCTLRPVIGSDILQSRVWSQCVHTSSELESVLLTSRLFSLTRRTSLSCASILFWKRSQIASNIWTSMTLAKSFTCKGYDTDRNCAQHRISHRRDSAMHSS